VASRGRSLSSLERHRVGELKAVGARKARALEALGIVTVLDLLTHYPRRQADRTNEQQIGALEDGEEAVVTARVVRGSSRRTRNGRLLAELVVEDGSGVLSCTFFNQPWQARRFTPGQVVTVFGKVRLYNGRRQMDHPLVDLVGDQTGRLVAVYPRSGKAAVDSPELGRYVAEALDRAGELADPLPAEARARLGLLGRTAAFRAIHAPETMEQWFAARRRLAFDELLRLQVLLVGRRRAAATHAKGIAHDVPGELVERYLSRLSFELTTAQRRAIEEIRRDLAAPHPMHRLLQGDVGAGKTVVALAALLIGVEGGHQGAFMVPTEVLAEQHYLSARSLLGDLAVADSSRIGGSRPLAVALLTSRTPASERSRLLAELHEGSVDLVIGTHALISEGVEFARLGVVVVDEQHRFGVEQRAALHERVELDPDLLVMTATPIPRTAAMTVYGDLDHTTLDELPAGRRPVTTRWAHGEGEEETVWHQVREEVAAGHQAYVVCPLVGGGIEAGDELPEDPDLVVADEDEAGEAVLDGGGPGAPPRLPGMTPLLAAPRRPPKAAVAERDRLVQGPLAGCRVGLLHGQMPAREKEPVMAAFRNGEIDVLVATTVVEVGVDVANATVMVVEDADRFGLAQLHQLRGRVGRSSLPSWCWLVTPEEVSEQAKRRLAAMVATEDGFALAEEDLDLRGGGTVLGARQKGRTDLKLANLRRDRDLVSKARAVAEEILGEDPTLDRHQLLREEVDALLGEEERAFLFRS
jgi:ATP-dependent DNA helicase RecG